MVPNPLFRCKTPKQMEENITAFFIPNLYVKRLRIKPLNKIYSQIGAMKERVIAFIKTNHMLCVLTISFVFSSEVLFGINENTITISNNIH